MIDTGRHAEAVTVRAMRWPDLDAVRPIETASFGSTAWSTETFWAELAGVPDSREYWVALEAGRIVGYAGVRVVPPDAEVQTIARSLDAAARGIGDRLLVHAVNEAVRRGCTQLLLEVAADNETARRLYERHGFEQIARRSGYYGSGRDALVMRRRLVGRGSPGGAIE